MLAIVIARYADDPALLADTRPAHHAYARRLRAAGRLLAAGPFADATGGVFVYEAATLDDVRRLVADDPFQTCGVFVDVEIKAWTIHAIETGSLARLIAAPPSEPERTDT